MNQNTQAPRSDDGRGQGNGSGELVVHPATGEVVGALSSAPPETLADVWLALKERERELKDMRELVTRELAARLHTRGRAVWTVGEYEIRNVAGKRSAWDGDELERVLRQLIDEGVVTASEVGGLVEHQIKVDGRGMNRLVSRLVGNARRAVEACRTWEKGRASFDVVRSVDLLASERDELERAS